MLLSSSDNNIYPQLCKAASIDDSVFDNFKSNPIYNEILEHVTQQEGAAYLNHIKLDDNVINNIERFQINDKLGGPKVFKYDAGTFSPTTLRYGKVLVDLLQLSLEDTDIVEIGCGYGGQYTILRQFVTPKSYTFVDLPDALNLQKKYIERLGMNDIPTIFATSDDLPTANYGLCISNYAISECAKCIQDIYIDSIVNNSAHGYIIHNNFEGYTHNEFIDKIYPNANIHNEIPQTCSDNVLITW